MFEEWVEYYFGVTSAQIKCKHGTYKRDTEDDIFCIKCGLEITMPDRLIAAKAAWIAATKAAGEK